MMYRYIYGEFSHPEYEAFRNGADFARRDAIVDSASRFRQADENLDLLLTIRSKTKFAREEAQRHIREVVEGNKSIDDVRREMVDVRETIEDTLQQEAEARQLIITSGPGALLGAVRGITAVLEHSTREGWEAVAAFLEAANRWRQVFQYRARRKKLARKHPLAWIGTVAEKEITKHQLRRRRRR